MFNAIKIFFAIKKVFDELGGIHTAEKVTELIADIFQHFGASPFVVEYIRKLIEIDEQNNQILKSVIARTEKENKNGIKSDY